jgi:hypothetical protein
MIAGSSGLYSAVSARDHETPPHPGVVRLDFMIVASSGRYLTVSGHDHETPGRAAAFTITFVSATLPPRIRQAAS